MDLEIPDIPVGNWGESVIDFFRGNPVFDAFQGLASFMISNLAEALLWIPALVLIAAFAALALWVRDYKFAIFVALSFLLVVSMDMWEPAMETFALVLVASLFSVAIGIPVGILASRNEVVLTVVRPILDLMQTMPAFVYLIPAVTFFGIGLVPGAVATLVFSMPPAVRLTNLGIRGVDEEVVEAAQAFGAKPRQILFRIQIPLALPTIMAGVNQVIMLALSMVVIAGMAGAGGLGTEVFRSISQLDIPLGVESGLSVVVVAIFLDRISEALGAGGDTATST